MLTSKIFSLTSNRVDEEKYTFTLYSAFNKSVN
jgi:hypothetical protein